MKKPFAIFIASLLVISANAQLGGFFNKVQNKVGDKVSDKTADDVGKSMDKNGNNSQNNNQQNNQQSNTQQGTTQQNSATQAAAPTKKDSVAVYKAYSNYDFVPGDTVIFEDHFADDQDGEFPAHWNLEAGQGLLNKVGDDETFSLTQGNYVRVSPRMKTKSYLTGTFTVEFNYYGNSGYGLILFFFEANQNQQSIHFENSGQVSSGGFSKDFSSPFPDPTAKFQDKWHHAAFIFKKNQIKCYVDQYRVLVMPNVEEVPAYLQFGGIGELDKPILFKDIRIASGGSMNMIGKKFTDSKIITHGINFDIDKATIKPESMGTLNMIVKVMKDNPDLKFEVDGHTDNSGDAKHNLTLSQQRADAVKAQLVSMGVDDSRLTTKGLGDTKPISGNDSPEGMANNRRVEFVRM